MNKNQLNQFTVSLFLNFGSFYVITVTSDIQYIITDEATCDDVFAKEANRRSPLPLTCLTQRSAYLRVLTVLDLLLLHFSDGKCLFSSFRVLKSSFWFFALADCSLLQGIKETQSL